jgi:HPr kinase/phosphorylase
VSAAPPTLAHGTAVALGDSAVLIRGPSGSGKSDLALRCIGQAPGGIIRSIARLVADDQVVLTQQGSDLIVSAPATLAGRLEVRGVGIVEVPVQPTARLVLIVDLVAPDRIERMPEVATGSIAGVVLPRLLLTPFEATAALKLLLCLQRVAT